MGAWLSWHKHLFHAPGLRKEQTAACLLRAIYFYGFAHRQKGIFSNSVLLWWPGDCSQTFTDRLQFVGPVLSPRSNLFQENSIFQTSFDQKFGKPGLTQMRHEQNGCEKLQRPFSKIQWGKHTKMQEFMKRTRQVKIIAVNIFFVKKNRKQVYSRRTLKAFTHH